MPDYIPDYTELHARYEAEQERLADKLPKCDCCGEPIPDDFLYDLGGTLYCEDCLEDHFRKPVDDYIK